jgi:hypothetical protein
MGYRGNVQPGIVVPERLRNVFGCAILYQYFHELLYLSAPGFE